MEIESKVKLGINTRIFPEYEREQIDKLASLSSLQATSTPFRIKVRKNSLIQEADRLFVASSNYVEPNKMSFNITTNSKTSIPKNKILCVFIILSFANSFRIFLLPD